MASDQNEVYAGSDSRFGLNGGVRRDRDDVERSGPVEALLYHGGAVVAGLRADQGVRCMDKEAKEDEAEPNERKSAKNHLSANSFSTKKEAKADEKEQSEGKSDRETLSTQRSFRKGGR